MSQAFIIVLREGFEAFLIVALIASYLRKTRKFELLPAVRWGIAAALALSAGIGYFLFSTDSNQPLWEGLMGLVSAVLVGGFVIHMWKTAPRLKEDMEKSLSEKTAVGSTGSAWWGVFAFTVFMISREGMETALMLFQVHSSGVVAGSLLGALGALAIALLWARASRLIDLGLFFRVTSVFLMLFIIQILIYSFHEFTETGFFPNAEYWHVATEPYGPDGFYGKWYSVFMAVFCALWMAVSVLRKKTRVS